MGVKRKRMRKLEEQKKKVAVMKEKDFENMKLLKQESSNNPKNEENVPILYIPVGISGCGKSTWAKKECERLRSRGVPCDIISSDALRLELYGNENDQMHNEEVFKELHRRLKDRLRNGISVIVDATNLSLKNRKAYMNCVKKIPCIKKAIIFDIPLEDCIKHQDSREKKVPEEVLFRMRMKFEIPFYEEGYDNIVFFTDMVESGEYFNSVFNYGQKHVVTDILDTEMFKKQVGFDQRTHHHIYTLDKHSLELQKYIHKLKNPYKNDYTHNSEFSDFEYTRDIVEKVALFHDYGKLFVGMPKDDGSDEYKYFNHHNVSAYEMMLHRFEVGLTNDTDILEFLFYVNYHMMPFFIQTQKTEKKWKEIFGEWKYQWLCLFNDADKFASGTDRHREKGEKP